MVTGLLLIVSHKFKNKYSNNSNNDITKYDIWGISNGFNLAISIKKKSVSTPGCFHSNVFYVILFLGFMEVNYLAEQNNLC